MTDEHDLSEFSPFPKISRLYRDIVVSEKIDGTNAQVVVNETMTEVRAASRKRWITPDDDHFGFARWVDENASDLVSLGPGRHFGEWWGSGIQRGYGLSEKRFSLFNSKRWGEDRPGCCHVVPILYSGVFSEDRIEMAMAGLHKNGSHAAPGFMNPEGVIVYHEHANQLFKYTLGRDGHKG